MPKTIEQNKLLKEKRKEEILNASLRLFANFGVESITMDEIAKEVGCSHGLIYHYFDSKEEIAKELSLKSRKLFNYEFLKISQKETDIISKFKEFHHLFIKSVKESEEKRFYLFLLLTLPYNSLENQEIKAYYKKGYKKLVNIFQEIIEQNDDLKLFSAKQLADSYYFYLTGLVYSSIKDPTSIKKIDENFILDIIRI